MSQLTQENLIRGIRRWDIVAIVINSTIGAGIFGLPSTIYGHIGAYSIIALVACAVLIGLVVLCLAELSSRFDKTGGPYLYALEAFGPIVGFEVGWLMWLQRLTAFAAICNLLITYLSFIWPAAGSGIRRVVIITAVAALLTGINVRRVRETAIINNIFTIGKLIPILFFILVGIFYIEPQNYSFAELPSRGAFSTSMLLFLFVFAGYDGALVPAGEIHEPRHNLPFALFTALGAVTLIYVLVQIVCIGTLPELAESERPLVDSSSRILGSAGAWIIVIGAIISILGSLAAVVLAAPRILFALAVQRQLPQVISATHKQFHTPHVAVLISSAVMLALTLSGTFIYAITINSMVRLITYIVSCMALIALRRRDDVQAPAFRVPAGSVVSVVTMLMCLWVLSNSTWREARDLGIVVAIGLVIYILNRRWQHTSHIVDRPDSAGT
jgi:APA family basic amino acid/polyamine antiporter